MIVVEFRKLDEPYIPEDHGIEIKSHKIAEAESTNCKEDHEHSEQRGNQCCRGKAGLIEHNDLELSIEFSDVDE